MFVRVALIKEKHVVIVEERKTSISVFISIYYENIFLNIIVFLLVK